MKKLICFDLDGTLTQHRTPLAQDTADFLKKLQKKYKLVMVGAGDVMRIHKQMNGFPIEIIGNYGMQQGDVIDGEFKVTKQIVMPVDKDFFNQKCMYLREKYGYTEYAGEHVEFHSSGMVTFPMLGTKAPIEKKVAFDPTREKRKVLYPEVLQIFSEYSVYIGGSSSFDFSPKEYNKYHAVMRYAEQNGYKKDEILYVGDDFGVGGGDSHIALGGIDYVEITDYKTVTKKLEYLLEE